MPPLSLPDTERAASSPDDALRSEAVRLFVQRAQAVRADFAADARSAAGHRRDLPPPGRPAAGDRAGGGARHATSRPARLLDRLERPGPARCRC